MYLTLELYESTIIYIHIYIYSYARRTVYSRLYHKIGVYTYLYIIKVGTYTLINYYRYYVHSI